MTTFSRIVERYGDDAQIFEKNGEMRVSKCFIQPVMPRTSEKMFSEMTVLGEVDKSGYYGYFPDCADVCDAEYVICDGVSYDIKRTEKFKIRGKVSHWEALLKKREEIYGV